MLLKKIQVRAGRDLLTNTYIVCDKNEAMVIDPGGEPERIVELLDILEIKELKYIFLTHCHADHIGGIKGVKDSKGGKILISRDDSKGFYNKEISLTDYIDVKITDLEVDSRVDDNDLIHIGDLEFKVILTPGHTKGSCCLYSEKEKLVFTGDTLFSGTWGRTDLPTGNYAEIMDSISNKLMILPDETICYPGHGKTTMIQDEKDMYLELMRKGIC